MASPTTPKFFRLSTPAPHVTQVEINRPSKLNSFHEEMWLELRSVFDALSTSPDVRTIVLSGAGDRAFSAGLDVVAASQTETLQGGSGADVARRAAGIRRHILEFQECISAIERCEKPVICVLHGISYGLAIDIAAAADVRIASRDARMAVKEVDIGLAADIGSLSRLPKVVGSLGWVKEVALSAREFGAEEAQRVGFVGHVKESKREAVEEAIKLAGLIASKSPVAVQGTKEILNHAKDHSVEESLRYTAIWNAANLQTDDIKAALFSTMKKTKPTFAKL
ncbi:ClpP/crotonase-like domain-containing protein [Coniochaeta sp. 2T2.1]|nr:ClpP/crotonase-like domain-containing protein [Coniochaeta sp. 2T2.1]